MLLGSALFLIGVHVIEALSSDTFKIVRDEALFQYTEGTILHEQGKGQPLLAIYKQ